MNKWVKFGLGIVVSVASLWWALKDTNIEATLTAVKSASWGTTP